VDGESEVVLSKPPIEVTIDPKGEALKPSSRLDLSKLHTIDYDIPVARLGKIAPRYVADLRHYCGLGSTSQTLDDPVEDVEEEDE
jgi:hypothetical protein